MAAKRKSKRRSRSAVVLINRPKARRTHHRRRNPPAMSIGGAIERVTQGVIGGGVIVATEMGTRLIRKRILNMSAGTLAAGAAEVGISTAAGILAERFVGPRIAQLIIDGGFASVIRATLKQIGTPAGSTTGPAAGSIWADALGDSPSRNFVVRGGRVFPSRSRLSGYVTGAQPALGGYVPGSGAAGMAAAFDVATS